MIDQAVRYTNPHYLVQSGAEVEVPVYNNDHGPALDQSENEESHITQDQISAIFETAQGLRIFSAISISRHLKTYLKRLKYWLSFSN